MIYIIVFLSLFIFAMVICRYNRLKNAEIRKDIQKNTEKPLSIKGIEFGKDYKDSHIKGTIFNSDAGIIIEQHPGVGVYGMYIYTPLSPSYIAELFSKAFELKNCNKSSYIDDYNFLTKNNRYKFSINRSGYRSSFFNCGPFGSCTEIEDTILLKKYISIKAIEDKKEEQERLKNTEEIIKDI